MEDCVWVKAMQKHFCRRPRSTIVVKEQIILGSQQDALDDCCLVSSVEPAFFAPLKTTLPFTFNSKDVIHLGSPNFSLTSYFSFKLLPIPLLL